jgi:ABC-2 type transport system ATP-binding protein
VETGEASSVRRAGKSYASTRVLADVDLDLPRGAITVLLGPNGAGKTTLLRILAGILPPSEGTVEVLGIADPARLGRHGRSSRKTLRELRRRTGYVPQEIALDPEMTGSETLSLLAALHGVPRPARAGRIAELAAAFRTTAHMPRPVASWSGGLKRRLHLAAGMIHDPDLLLLDEPTAGLDPEGCDVLWAELARRAGAGRAVAVVTHDVAAAERHAHRVALLDGGRLLAAGSPAELCTRHGGATLDQVYRRLTGREPEGPPGRDGGGGLRRGRET